VISRSTILLIAIAFCLACTRQNKDQNSNFLPLKESEKTGRSGPASDIRPSLTSEPHRGKTYGSRNKRAERLRPTLSETKEPLLSGADSNRANTIASLLSKGATVDLNEPVSRAIFSSPLSPAEFPPVILLSRERFLKINFDNDIFDYTDRFYTNGVRIDLIHPSLSQNPLSRTAIPYWGAGENHYGISIVQNLYTPSTTKVGGIQYGDRPYAAYLYFGSFKITNDPRKRFRMTSELDLGIIGPYSLGEYMQKSFHSALPSNSEPEGWEYQVQSDAVLNYSLTFDKGIISERWLNLNLVSTTMVGTLYTNLSGGLLLRTGWMNPYYANLGVSTRNRLRQHHLKMAQGYLFVRGSAKAVGYDATLEGGMLNRSSPYTISGSDISRVVFQSSLGLVISYGGFQIEAEQFFLSPEFHGSTWHKWGHIGLTFCF
jgi:hypothetical protein